MGRLRDGDATADEGLATEWMALVGPDEAPDGNPASSPYRAQGVAEEDRRGPGGGEAVVGGTGAGIMSLIQSRDITYERLPMLEVVFDRLERMLTTSVRNFTSENVDISLENISTQCFSDYMNSVSVPAMISIYKAIQWDNYGLITVDSAMIYSVSYTHLTLPTILLV